MSHARVILKFATSVIALLAFLFVLSWLSPALAGTDPPANEFEDHPVNIATIKKATPDGTQFKLYAYSERTPYAVVKFEVTGNNIKVEPSTSSWRGLSRGMDDPAVTISKLDANKPFDYHYHYTSKICGRSTATREDYVYTLPFGPGKTFKISESYGGWSHKKNGPSEFAIDFDMPARTEVCAARDGVVIAVRSDATISGVKKEYENAANNVCVRHNDGTIAEYAHFVTDGVLVKPGANVVIGQPLGLAGATGYATGPHLHFCVFYFDDKMERRSIPVRFNTSQGLMVEPTLNRYVSR